MNDSPRVLVLGGTGKTGRRVAAALRHRNAGPAVASRRGPVRFDWRDRSTWRPALDGADAVYVVDSQTPDAPQEVREFTGLAAGPRGGGTRSAPSRRSVVWRGACE
ncbi:hypothetical protein ACLQ2R_27025 [Streptosporangium sp. DT93]|uniref:hypothetical protein n=1 Tax=Streptosporangium sp. DT93 TaxID=3393428 RepID=UPI003CF5DFE5